MTTTIAPRSPPALHTQRDPDFIYVVYIRASQDAVWAALTENQNERAWWFGTRMDSTFKPGAPHAFHRAGGVDVRGEILESEAPNRLSYTFHVEGPGLQHDEGPTMVECLLEHYKDTTKLTVTHSNFKKGGAIRPSISNGWPRILSNLKTMLEGGKPLHFAPPR